jgi:cbb3-type cytochrome oxidase cytochrome c subunit
MTHLYQPRAIYDWSIMPAYPYLFEIKDKAAAGDVVVALPERYAPKGKVVVARPQAREGNLKQLQLRSPSERSVRGTVAVS